MSKSCFKIPNRKAKIRKVPVVQRIEQGFPKGKTALLHASARRRVDVLGADNSHRLVVVVDAEI
jgi:hypothetical protein